MINRTRFRRLAFGLLAAVGLVVAAGTVPIMIGSFSTAQAQVSAEFQDALAPFGSWRRHARWGEVWVPGRRQSDWRPYEAGHWVYTEEWGWFWDTDESEADWGWITYHYGRWMHDETGWFWIPGDEWAPAWVDWRYSNDYVGWAPLPPDDVEVAYEAEPTIWVFVAPRYLTAPRWRTYIAPPQRRVAIFRESRVVNRTVTFRERGRAAVNPGISPAFIASVTHKPVQSFRVSPHVLASTQGVTGAVTVRPQDLRGKDLRGKASRGNGARGRGTVTRVSVEKTNVVIKPDAKPPQAPQALGKGENGRLGNRPPRAAQGATPAATQPSGQPAAPNGQQRPAATPATPPAAAPAAKPAAPAAPPPAPAAAPKAPAAAPAAAPPAPAAPPPAQVRPQRPPPPQAPPPVAHPGPPPHPAAPAPARPAPPPAAARPAPPPVAHPAPPPVAHPAPPPAAARPAPPPVAHPAPPPPAAGAKPPPPEAPK